jgi:AraC family transcriptional regulator of adaptative response/methylated-DNA-[protein]-cysteine methyltransferase
MYFYFYICHRRKSNNGAKDMKNNAPERLMFGKADSVFGECWLAFDESDIYSLLFISSEEAAIADLQHRLPKTQLVRNDSGAQLFVNRLQDDDPGYSLKPLGTPFQIQVWEALRTIPKGKTTTYAAIAEQIGNPKAVRAVGTAIGANPIGFLIPCHRVVRTDGGLGGFRWGLELKKKMLELEKGR